MNIEEIREYCISKPAVTEGFPFDQTTLVFKVMNKMFALTGLEGDGGEESQAGEEGGEFHGVDY